MLFTDKNENEEDTVDLDANKGKLATVDITFGFKH